MNSIVCELRRQRLGFPDTIRCIIEGAEAGQCSAKFHKLSLRGAAPRPPITHSYRKEHPPGVGKYEVLLVLVENKRLLLA